MKILIFNWRCWLNPAMGGAEVFTYEIAKRWANDGHTVTLFTSKFHDCKNEEVRDDIRVIRAGNKYSVYSKAKQYYQKRFSKEDFDIVIDEINTKPFFTPKFVKNGEKIIALIHQLAKEYWFFETPFPLNYLGYHFFEERWLREYVHLHTVTVSESSKQDLLNLGFKFVKIVPEGINFTPLKKVFEKHNMPIIAYSGRLKKAKRPDHAIKAFRLVKEHIPNAELWFFGDGPYRKDLENMAGDDVKFFNNLRNNQRRKLLRKCWILVNPSIREGWGLNIIEAGALGVPCVAYDVAGLRDSVTNNVTGLLIKNGDIVDFANKLILICKNTHLRQILSENALQNSRKFCWENTANQFLEFMESIINGK
jgi:glycosyltransferase involved in cell wall biosynthesis